HALFDDLALGLNALGKLISFPEVLECSGCRYKGMVVASEGTVVLARLPLIQITANEHDREGQAVTAERLGQSDDVRLDAHFFKAEKGTRPATTGLDVIDDQQHFVLAAELLKLTHPLGGSSVQTTFTLYDFDDHRRGLVDAAARIAQQF